MKRIKNRFNLSALFYLAFALYVAQSMTRWVIGISLLRRTINIVILILLATLIICKIKKIKSKELLLSVAIALISIAVSVVTSDYVFLYLSLFIFAAHDVNMTTIIKTDLIVKIIMIIIVMILYSNGLTEQIILKTKANSMIYSFGFGNPNTFGVYVFSICADLIYLNYRKKNLFIYMVSATLALLINEFCDSRSSFICIILLIVLSIFDVNKLKKKKTILKILTVSPLILLILSFASIYLYRIGNPVAIQLNDYLSKRVALASVFSGHYGIKLFGNYFDNYGTVKTVSIYGYLDNAYVMLLIRYGILQTIIFMFGIIRSINNSYKKDNRGIAAALLAYSAFGLMENGLYVLFYNPFLLSMSANERDDNK